MNRIHKKPASKTGSGVGLGKLQRNPLVLWLVLFFVVVGTSFLVYNRISDQKDDSQTLDADASAQNLDFTEVTAGLLNLANEYRKAGPDQKPALEQSMVQLAMERREQMMMALDTNPKAVARAAIPAGLAKQLPNEIARFIEEQATIEGVVEVNFVDYKDKESGKNPLEYTITDARSKARYKVKTKEPLNNVVNGTRVRMSGTVLEDNIVPLDAESFTVTSQVTTSALTQKKTALILINFQSNTTTYETHDSARAKLFTNPDSVNAYYKESSYGQIELIGHLRPDGDIFGYYTVPYNNDNCADFQLWSNSAKAMAAADGYAMSNYNFTLFLFDDNNKCAWSGKAGLGGSNASAWIATGHVNFTVVAHEMGHNMGMLHASSLRCTNASGATVSISNTCVRNEYGDPADIMGGSLKGHANNNFKGINTQYDIVNWIPATNVLTLASGQSGTYTLVPMQQPLTGIQTIRIPKNYTYTSGGTPTPGYYYLEFRQPFGFDVLMNYPNLFNGVFLRLGRNFTQLDYTNLVDATPETPTSFYDSALASGKTFTDTEAGITITTESLSPTGAVVNITTTPMPCQKSNPTMTVEPRFNGGTAGSTLVYEYTLTNEDTSGCNSSRFSITMNQSAYFTTTPSSAIETLAPGQSVTRPFSVTSSPSVPVSGPDTYYGITIYVVDTSDSNHKTTGNVNYSVTGPGTTPNPSTLTTNITSPITGAVLKAKSTVTISATASDSTSAVTSVGFYINEKLRCTDTTAPYTCSWKVPAGKKTYKLHTIATNSSGATKNSSTVTVTAK